MAKKLIATGYGDPSDVLEVTDVDIPKPGKGEVVVEVRAAGLNPYDVKLVRGFLGAKPENLPLSPGAEAAGVVHAAGPGSEFKAGDEVVVYPASATLAEYVVSGEDRVHRKPAGLGFAEAASLLLAGVTAVDTLATLGVTGDDVVLVHGGAGAVGSIVVTEALAAGATVIATAAPRNHDHLRAQGAIPVPYGDGLTDAVREARGDQRITAVIDTVGTDEAIDVSLELVAPHRIVSIAAWGRVDDGIVVIDGSSEQSRHHRSAAVEPLLTDAASGRITVEIARRFGFTDAGAAFDELLGAHPRGKFVFEPR
ncbi:quinone oxidoreductase family protein [Gordonia neofelifaecis]|uniref:Alcohol dehydrogenase GroES domain-containing protein n=1 Tax=Gordonia neofelifaecis NRRL B-59395 TaxID=644548 RepID=F1YJI8_9ACTN|nr:NADP-dependent oxidoreductase [Gordonia neofelifaecis]EGD55221.1 alcohol dehydrogenase GroES domain-containing protein [Gordonia neofelifaecis NRRL B-59395]